MGEQSKLPEEQMKNGITNGSYQNPDEEVMDEGSDEDEMTEEGISQFFLRYALF